MESLQHFFDSRLKKTWVLQRINDLINELIKWRFIESKSWALNLSFRLIICSRNLLLTSTKMIKNMRKKESNSSQDTRNSRTVVTGVWYQTSLNLLFNFWSKYFFKKDYTKVWKCSLNESNHEHFSDYNRQYPLK